MLKYGVGVCVLCSLTSVSGRSIILVLFYVVFSVASIREERQIPWRSGTVNLNNGWGWLLDGKVFLLRLNSL